jgi:acyl carrier protein
MTVRWLPDVQQVMSTVMAIAPECLRSETVPNQVPAWDSLSHLTLIVTLEERFGLCFSSTEIERMTSVGEICAILAERLDH